ncbi:MAG: histidinol-phosphatase HisJ family protein [Roseburia sp.]|nr:histidinol-phosphatase HisJ family protein [Roseburia sp.]
MKLLPFDTDLSGMDCHIHSRFSPDARHAGAGAPDEIAAAVRARGLRGFIITDHVDIGHWRDFEPINFDEYFDTWEKTRKKNPDLTIYIGLEVGFEPERAQETARLIKDLPLEYVINSVHYWKGPNAENANDHFSLGRQKSYAAYLEAISASLDAPYDFSTVGHLGFAERYSPYLSPDREIDYRSFKRILDEIADKAVKRRVRFEENTNSGGEIRSPRADFLRVYKDKGGVRPVLGSDAHTSASIGQHFDKAKAVLDDIFGKE